MLVSRLEFKPAIDKIKGISLWGILLSSLIGCGTSPISIEQISEKKIGRNVYITGKVVHLAPFVDNAAYQVEDATGKIWVVTEKDPPIRDRPIHLKGKIQYQSLPFDRQELGDFYLIELEQLEPPVKNSNRSRLVKSSVKFKHK